MGHSFITNTETPRGHSMSETREKYHSTFHSRRHKNMGIDTWEKGASLEDKGQEWYLHTYRPRLQATTSHLKEDS
jgi:hypothetical protein